MGHKVWFISHCFGFNSWERKSSINNIRQKLKLSLQKHNIKFSVSFHSEHFCYVCPPQGFEAMTSNLQQLLQAVKSCRGHWVCWATFLSCLLHSCRAQALCPPLGQREWDLSDWNHNRTPIMAQLGHCQHQVYQSRWDSLNLPSFFSNVIFRQTRLQH